MTSDVALWWATSVAFGTGFGMGTAIGWWCGDLLRRFLRWYWERRS